MANEERVPAKVTVRDKRRGSQTVENGEGGDARAADTPDASPSDEGGPPQESAAPEESPARSDYLEDLKRVQADFENYKKRMIREQTAIAERASGRLIESLLPVLDNFERAIEHGEGGEGVALVYKDFKKTLAQEGLEEISAEGVPFDPNVHEAVESHEDAAVDIPTADKLYRRGYTLKGKLLRPAMVTVARPVESLAETAPEQLESAEGK